MVLRRVRLPSCQESDVGCHVSDGADLNLRYVNARKNAVVSCVESDADIGAVKALRIGCGPSHDRLHGESSFNRAIADCTPFGCHLLDDMRNDGASERLIRVNRTRDLSERFVQGIDADVRWFRHVPDPPQAAKGQPRLAAAERSTARVRVGVPSTRKSLPSAAHLSRRADTGSARGCFGRGSKK